MLVFDQLRKNDPQLRAVALLVFTGLAILLAGLWWVQVVSARHYQTNLETQSYRTVRIPAVRGMILDRNGVPLAESRPTYNVSMYLEELRRDFDAAYFAELRRANAMLASLAEREEKKLGRKLNKQERRRFTLTTKDRGMLRRKARSDVASNVVFQVSHRLRQPIAFDPQDFQKHYETRLALPYPIIRNLNPTQVAMFEEQATSPLGVDLEILSTRYYPFGTTAAHVLGRLQRDDSSAEGEDSFFSYRLPDYRGLVGVEALFDRELRGQAGAKSVLVNNIGYRQTENVWSMAEPGSNVVLTLDVRVQQAAEQALADVYGPTTRGAAVVLDTRNGDILALASSPTLNPNSFIHGFTRGEWQRISELRAEPNRATQENYAPGSVFKTIVGAALLEAGHSPNAITVVSPNPHQPNKGVFYVGRRAVRDTAPPGPYDFKRAVKLSSNSYFIENGLKLGPEPIVRLAMQMHLGERTGLGTRQEVAGYIPEIKRLTSGWTDGNTANLCIGQDPVLVTPLQVALMTAAFANGGIVYWPRLAQRLESQGSALEQSATVLPAGRVRSEIKFKPRTLSALHEAMLADVEDPDGTGAKAEVPGLRVCGKTGTAQVQDEYNRKTGQITWFASFAPFDQPRWAVVVMVEDGASGGGTCAPAAGKIYAALLETLKSPTPALARNE